MFVSTVAPLSFTGEGANLNRVLRGMKRKLSKRKKRRDALTIEADQVLQVGNEAGLSTAGPAHHLEDVEWKLLGGKAFNPDTAE